MGFLFSRTFGMEPAKASLSQAILTNKFPHALLIHGAEGVGQNPLLLDVADILLCEVANEHRPCGKCSPCRGRKANSLDNLIFMLPIEKKEKASSEGKSGSENKSAVDSEMESGQIDELSDKWHEFQQNPYGFSHSDKSHISIAQVRDSVNRISYSESSKKIRIVVIPWAETMAPPAANALLKTLEEPPVNTYFLLSSSDRASILPTILSRCTQLSVFPMDTADLLETLQNHGSALGLESLTPKLLPFADGSLGSVLQLHRHSGESLLEQGREFWEAALSGDWRQFSDFLDSSDSFADMTSALDLLHFLLKMLRVFHRLEMNFASEKSEQSLSQKTNPYAWTEKALVNQGFEVSLATYLGPLEKAPSLLALSQLCEEMLKAIQGYAKPKMAALGLYLEYENKYGKKRAVPA